MKLGPVRVSPGALKSERGRSAVREMEDPGPDDLRSGPGLEKLGGAHEASVVSNGDLDDALDRIAAGE